ncbi:MAG: DoxX family protein [Flavobacterium sp. BFFFF1]|uniref:DoxX family protein n=1 Tax=unclassified Flavobacterium TaxID=196869 RepID=UPI000BDA5623|nr:MULTISPECIES: DoxX family protein [unclassified Flavobacterium]OYU81780.1 MAG: DoxX family protein [Flavobacterium sp. BFFFF1]
MKKILSRLTKPMTMKYWWQDLLFAIPRIVCGYLLTSNFGAAKFGMPWSPPDNNLGLFEVAFWFPNDVAQYGGIFATFSVFFAWMGAFSEAVGGLMLVVGFQTRIASFLLVWTMIVASFVQHLHDDMWNKLPGMGFLWVAIFTTILGSGKFGLDYLLTLKSNKK